MVYWYESVLLYIVSILVPIACIDPSREACLAFESDYHITTACECVVFQSFGLSEGYFYSPNYPSFYKPGIHCILYTFVGDVNEIVEIKFIAMDLKRAVRISHNTSQCKDFIRLYTNLERPEINENSPSEEEMCGHITKLDEKVFFSSGRSLILEFHSDHESRENHTGFKGSFTFREKHRCDTSFDTHLPDSCTEAYKTDGIARFDTLCQYDIISYRNRTRGKFFSPRYPQKYPHSSFCQYLFIGQDREKVKVMFTAISLPSNSNNCEGNGDVIRVYDGKTNSARLIRSFCNLHNNTGELISSGTYMYIEFQSDRYVEKQGFAADYQFIDATSVLNPSPTNVLQCNETIESRTIFKKNGTISSPNYPYTYPPNTVCEYEFVAENLERIQIHFTKTDLYYSLGNPENAYGCSTQDSIKVLTYANSKEDPLGEYCGRTFPTQIMSTGQRMKIRFKSEDNTKNSNSAFRFVYSFKTDFGVLGNGIQDNRKECKFTYNSSRASSGEFTSPNYPGLYPRNIECNYSFHGKPKEIVNITFDKFQLSGCDEQTNSDVITFSNFINAEDRKMPRYCGLPNGYSYIVSDGPFFRVTFRSNEKYEAEGFKGMYTFKMVVNDVTLAPTSFGSSGTGTEFRCQGIIVIATVILMLSTQ